MAEPQERLAHLLILGRAQSENYTRRGMGSKKVRAVESRAHGTAIQEAAVAALAAQDSRRESVDLGELEALGVVITIEGAVDYPLKLESLERLTTHRISEKLPKWLLLSVSPETDDTPEKALVWVSDEYREAFMKLFEDYLTRESKGGHPLNRELVANMSQIRATVLQDLWQSDGEPPTAGTHWWEIWLRPTSDAVDAMRGYAEANELTVVASAIRFDTRRVMWVRARWDQLDALPFTSVPVAEIRRPVFVDTIEDLPSEEQEEFTADLLGRVQSAPLAAPAVCVLDTGIRRSHLLLEPSLAADDMHTVAGPPLGDQEGHGTQMAGLALFGHLDDLLTGTSAVRLEHRLESVKLLPDPGSAQHDPLVYGVVTAEAIALPEIANTRRRAYCMAITAKADKPGEPSLWSAAVDALAAGTDIGQSASGIELLGPPEPSAARLIIVSAGNVDPPYSQDYRALCDTSPIDDPAQAWNALTVGAHTHLTQLPTDPTFAGWTALARDGDISPHSRTGVAAGGRAWPIKPDICMEGGNVLTDGQGDFHQSHEILSLRTTDRASEVALGSANATSAATALAARLAARAMARYPAYWPETIRGLLVHSADWTATMKAEIAAVSGKRNRLRLLKRYGWGVPDEATVLTSARNAVTMVVQDEFSPFSGKAHKVRHFRLHQLPWPQEVLADLGAADVQLRVTLSYFIEPSAARRGWRQRYAYASHGLRFDLRSPGETTPEFIRRVNRAAAVEEDGGVAAPDSGTANWTVGPNQRDKGSLHQDLWDGSGAELAATGGVLAVHAVGGWWKNNTRADRADLPVRYSLLVSLRTAEQAIDLYTPIATMISVPIEAAAIEA